MPVTPFHFGPGALATSLAPNKISWVMFGLANIVIDLEVITYYAITEFPTHGYLHTYVGATVLGVLVAIYGRKTGEWLLCRWNAWLSPSQASWLGTDPRISLKAALWGSLVGTLSHVFLDSIMHGDIHPWWPISEENPMQGVMSVDALQVFCVMTGIWGLLRLLIQRWDVVRKHIFDAPWRPFRPMAIAEGFLRDTVAVIRSILGFICVCWAISVPFEASIQKEMRMSPFSAAAWQGGSQDVEAIRKLRLQMSTDLISRLGADRPNRDHVREMLGTPNFKDKDDLNWEYRLGTPNASIGIYLLLIDFGDDGRVSSARIHRD